MSRVRPPTIAAGLGALTLLGACIVGPNPKFIEGDHDSSSGSESGSDGGPPDTGDGNDGDGDGGNDSNGNNAPPTPPEGLTILSFGDEADADVEPLGPGVILFGGAGKQNPAFEWQAERIAGGDIVVLQLDDDDKLGAKLYDDIGGADSVQVLVLDTPAFADDPWVLWTLSQAEAVVIAEEDSRALLETWAPSLLGDAIASVWQRGGIVTSLQPRILGDYASVGVSSGSALANPYHRQIEVVDGFLDLPVLARATAVGHFIERDYMGLLLTLLARILADGPSPFVVGIGVDRETALAIGPDGIGEVLGDGFVYLIHGDTAASSCEPWQTLEFGPVTVQALAAGDLSSWPGGGSSTTSHEVSASDGATLPPDPY